MELYLWLLIILGILIFLVFAIKNLTKNNDGGNSNAFTRFRNACKKVITRC